MISGSKFDSSYQLKLALITDDHMDFEIVGHVQKSVQNLNFLLQTWKFTEWINSDTNDITGF